MGVSIITDDKGAKVFRKDGTSQAGKAYTTYSLGVSSKDQSGKWHNGYIDCAFKKGVSVNNKAVIKIKKSFFNVSEYNGKTYNRLMITDFDVLEEGEGAAVNTSIDDFMMMDGTGEELPFA